MGPSEIRNTQDQISCVFFSCQLSQLMYPQAQDQTLNIEKQGTILLSLFRNSGYHTSFHIYPYTYEISKP